MRILVFQHLPVENPGVFLDFWAQDGHVWDVVSFDTDAPIPDLHGYDALVVMGGPMNVWEDDFHPWLRREKAAIRQWVVDLARPYLGICLGHQLLGHAVGAHVGPMSEPEVGIVEIPLTPAGRDDPLFKGIDSRLDTLQWHGAEVTGLPGGLDVLASNEACAVQAFRYGRHAYGLQFHIEITASTVAAWREIPSYKASLETALGTEGAERLGTQVAERLATSRDLARRINANFMALVAPAVAT